MFKFIPDATAKLITDDVFTFYVYTHSVLWSVFTADLHWPIFPCILQKLRINFVPNCSRVKKI